jgi:hypothetical protein
MEHRTGTTTAFRGALGLGEVKYDFTLRADGRVSGHVTHVDHVGFHRSAPRVPVNFLPQAIVLTDLHLSLGDGTEVHFVVINTDGLIQNGQRRPTTATR